QLRVTRDSSGGRFLPGGVALWANVPRLRPSASASSLISPKGLPHPAARSQAGSVPSATRSRRLRVPAKRSGKGGAPDRRLKTLWRRAGAPPFPLRSAVAARAPLLQWAMPRTLHQWLEYIEQQHPKSIELGLDRVRAVAERMQLARPARKVVTVAGTNGKGSTVAFIEAIARAAGWRTGAYTSPHLLAYNERVRIAGEDVPDEALVAGFEAVEAARGDTPLTYFEHGTLCALWLFARADLDLAVLEVGLGGRLDAVNIVDADVAVVTTVDIDHVDWLGADREAIGLEKAGIARAWKPL